MTPGRATIVKRITSDGLVELADEVPVGVERTVDLDSIREMLLHNTEWQKAHTKLVVDVVAPCPCGQCGLRVVEWMPLELLKLEARQ